MSPGNPSIPVRQEGRFIQAVVLARNRRATERWALRYTPHTLTESEERAAGDEMERALTGQQASAQLTNAD